jgi:putative PIN family toxin of toxin-antitoxin system
MNGKVRVVFDCNTYLQALAAPEGPAGRCVQSAFDGVVLLFICPEVLDEIRDVASRPAVAAKLQLAPDRVDEFLEAIQITATILRNCAKAFVCERDPDDEIYVDLAVAAGAEFIVTRDNDLLDLTDSSKAGGAEFLSRFPSLRIVTPVQFMREIESRTKSEVSSPIA